MRNERSRGKGGPCKRVRPTGRSTARCWQLPTIVFIDNEFRLCRTGSRRPSPSRHFCAANRTNLTHFQASLVYWHVPIDVGNDRRLNHSGDDQPRAGHKGLNQGSFFFYVCPVHLGYDQISTLLRGLNRTMLRLAEVFRSIHSISDTFHSAPPLAT